MKIEEVFARRRFIMLDGAMGTQLQLRGLTTEQKPELAAFIMPDVLTAVHRDYARAGADILLANTFGANPRKLKGTGYTVQQVIEASIACARAAAQETGALVALDIGPIGELLAPAGTLPFEDACAQFAEMVRAGAAAGADLVFLETMTDLYELKAAILAAKENCDLPVFRAVFYLFFALGWQPARLNGTLALQIKACFGGDQPSPGRCQYRVSSARSAPCVLP